MTRESEFSQFGDPRGLKGRVVLWLMALKNRGMNKAAHTALALEAGDQVLEIGCGPGLALKHAARRIGRAGFAAGIDHAPLAVSTALRRNRGFVRQGRVEVRCASVQSIPYPDRRFNAAYAVNSFQFWPAPEDALAELRRVLQTGARLVLTQRAANTEIKMDFAGASGGWDRIEKAASFLPDAGFEIEEVRETQVGRLIAASIIATAN